jgi:hypothetical protein
VVRHNGYSIPFLTTSKVILFYAGISALENWVRVIFELLHTLTWNRVLWNSCLKQEHNMKRREMFICYFEQKGQKETNVFVMYSPEASVAILL